MIKPQLEYIREKLFTVFGFKIKSKKYDKILIELTNLLNLATKQKKVGFDKLLNDFIGYLEKNKIQYPNLIKFSFQKFLLENKNINKNHDLNEYLKNKEIKKWIDKAKQG